MAIDYSKLNPKTTTAVFSYNVPYAIFVHEGVVMKNGGVMPARPWIRVAMREFDFAGTMRKLAFAYDGDIEKAFKETCLLLGAKFTELISSPTWDWTDGGTRDIVDKGALRASQQLEFFP